MTLKELEKNECYYYHHSATAQGYVSVKVDGIVEPYQGRFGHGYKVYTHNPKSTCYCIVSYYIAK